MKTDHIQQFILKNEDNLRIAASVIEVWPQVRQRIVDGFLERLETQLKMKLGGWEFSRDEQFFEDRIASYDFTKSAWGGEYNLGLQAYEYGSKMVIGVWRDKDKIAGRPFSDELLDAIQKNHPTARFVKPWWDAAVFMKSPASDWQKPGVLWQMNKDSTFLDDVAEQLLDLAKTSEPFLDGLVQNMPIRLVAILRIATRDCGLFFWLISWRDLVHILAMSIIERLDLIIALLDAGKPAAEIKGRLVSMREEIEAYSNGADALDKLKSENAQLKNAKFDPPSDFEGMVGGG